MDGGLLRQILLGYKKMFAIIASLLLCAGIMCGIVASILMAASKISFSWWYLPCWLLDLTAIAGAIGTCE